MESPTITDEDVLYSRSTTSLFTAQDLYFQPGFKTLYAPTPLPSPPPVAKQQQQSCSTVIAHRPSIIVETTVYLTKVGLGVLLATAICDRDKVLPMMFVFGFVMSSSVLAAGAVDLVRVLLGKM